MATLECQFCMVRTEDVAQFETCRQDSNGVIQNEIITVCATHAATWIGVAQRYVQGASGRVLNVKNV